MKVVVIGGGLFGCCAALELDRAGHDVTLYEARSDIMCLASRVNHARLHIGYHYPRSPETARQSIEGLLSFFMEFKDFIRTGFPNYYAIAAEGSQVTVDEYRAFCADVGISLLPAWPDAECLCRDRLAACFLVREPVFDWRELAVHICRRLHSRVCVKYCLQPTLTDIDDADFTINCTYARVNEIQNLLGLPEIPLCYEKCSIPVFEWAHEPIGLTVMDGPFCTVMPYGYWQNHFLLYHVEQSVQGSHAIYESSAAWLPFLPAVSRSYYLYTTRVVKENPDDARLTEIYRWPQRPNYLAVLSGKLTTAVRCAVQVREIIEGNPNAMRYLI